MAAALRAGYVGSASVASVVVQAGDIILVFTTTANTLTATSISDTIDTYTQVGTGKYISATGQQQHVFWARASTSGTRTITQTGGSASPTTHVQVISGALASGTPTDGQAFTTTSTSGTTATTATITPTTNGCYIAAFFAEDVASAVTYSVGSSGFTLATSRNAADVYSNSFYKIQATAAAISMTASINKATFAGTCIIAIKPAVASSYNPACMMAAI